MRTLVLVALLATSVGLGQMPTPTKEKPKKSELETLLEEAFKSNPDLRVAEAKLVEAQAELSRARLALTQKVVVADAALRAARAASEDALRRLNRVKKLALAMAVSDEEITAAEQATIKAKADVEMLEAKLNYLRGKVSDRDKVERLYDRGDLIDPYSPRGVETTRVKEMPTGSMVDNLRKALEMEMDFNVEDVDPADAHVNEVLNTIEKKYKLSFLAPRLVMGEEKMLFPVFRGGPRFRLQALLSFIEDSSDIVFVVREYGLLAVRKEKVPPGALTLREFRKLPAPKTAIEGEKPQAGDKASTRR